MNSFVPYKNKPREGILVSAIFYQNPGEMVCVGYDLLKSKQVFEENIGIATNNIGEFCAIGFAMNHLMKNKTVDIIWSHSKYAMKWVKKNSINSEFGEKYPELLEKNKNLYDTLYELSNTIDNSSSCVSEIKFWDKARYGENLAKVLYKKEFEKLFPKYVDTSSTTFDLVLGRDGQLPATEKQLQFIKLLLKRTKIEWPFRTYEEAYDFVSIGMAGAIINRLKNNESFDFRIVVPDIDAE